MFVCFFISIFSYHPLDLIFSYILFALIVSNTTFSFCFNRIRYSIKTPLFLQNIGYFKNSSEMTI